RLCASNSDDRLRRITNSRVVNRTLCSQPSQRSDRRRRRPRRQVDHVHQHHPQVGALTFARVATLAPSEELLSQEEIGSENHEYFSSKERTCINDYYCRLNNSRSTRC